MPLSARIPLAIIAITGWFLLPDTLAVQFRMSGEPGKSAPKIVGLLVPVAVGIPGTVYASSKKAEQRLRGFIISALAVFVLVGIFVFNI